jgi:hypothetical protein
MINPFFCRFSINHSIKGLGIYAQIIHLSAAHKCLVGVLAMDLGSQPTNKLNVFKLEGVAPS